MGCLSSFLIFFHYFVIFLSIGMAFSWGYMFPAELIAEYDGKYLTQVAYVDYTNSAGEYEVHIWQGGDTAPATEIARQAGVYMVRVASEKGISTKRVTVM